MGVYSMNVKQVVIGAVITLVVVVLALFIYNKFIAKTS